ncbi:MAG: hypothetical protein ACJ76F_00885 [Bacteroidia bacterium]
MLSFCGISQTTIGNKPKPELAEKPGVLAPGKKHKVMLIPFEKKMYMSQIDHKINAETKWDQKKIRAAFREGIDDELYKKLKSRFDVLSLLDDTIKYKKDIAGIYEYLSYKYDKVPNQQHYTAPKTEKEKPNIKKGQLMTESVTGEHFMNAKITSPALIPGLYAKYKTDIFLFVNQIDILSSNTLVVEAGNMNSRTITIHYTVFTVDAKEINSGTCSVKFPADVNNPSKIVSSYLSKIAEEIARRMDKAVYPVAVNK